MLWLGRFPSLVISSMLTESMPTNRAPREASHSAPGTGEERGVLGILRRPPGCVTAGVQQHRTTGDVECGERADVDRTAPATRGAHHDSGKIGAGVERQVGEVHAVGITVVRAIEVGAGVADHADAVDRELGTRRVDLA